MAQAPCHMRNLGQELPFLTQKRPLKLLETTKQWKEMVSTLYVRLDFVVSKTPLVPSNSTICLRHTHKRPPKARESAQAG